MFIAYDTLLQTEVNASNADANSNDEAFRYVCLCCGEEVYLAARDSIYRSVHFRHRNGNNDRECELYLGQYGIVPASSSITNKQDRVDFYYNNPQKTFLVSFKFSDSELTAYENAAILIEVRASCTSQPFLAQV